MEEANNRLEDNITLPLVSESNDNKNEKCIEDHTMVYISTFVAVFGSYAVGACAGYTSPIQSAISKDINLTIAQYSLFGSILTFGAMIGAITSGRIADFIGRKGALRVASVFCIVGWLVIYFAQAPMALNIGRLLTGYAMGVFSYVVPVFIAEIAPKNLRGALTAANQFMNISGVSVSFIIGTVITWRTLALAGIIPCIVLLLGLFFIPESPRWLAKTGNQKTFVVALQQLRGKGIDISEESAEFQDYIETLEMLPKAKLLDLFQKRYMRSVTIAVGLMVCQQFGGINGICFYVSSIFESSGFPADLGTIIYACVQVVITGLGIFVIDRAGRKPLLLVSASGLTIGCLITAMAFYLKTYEIGLKAAPALAVTGILVYTTTFYIRMRSVPWVMMSEFYGYIMPKLEVVNRKPDFLNRNVNEGFSGGEKKRSEILQLANVRKNILLCGKAEKKRKSEGESDESDDDDIFKAKKNVKSRKAKSKSSSLVVKGNHSLPLDNLYIHNQTVITYSTWVVCTYWGSCLPFLPIV